ncbi:MAG: hypothetical protein L3J28_08860 [Candidatus Polarisedimenticolaceae bacterium]|nr:hypothetical protein [Candidatus Polarisedimenticolaceae bacterium]
MNSTESSLFALLMYGMFLTCVLYVIFGQLTVRKLRKNPETKDALGLEYASGWDIINVAQALAFPKSWNRIMGRSPLSFMHANSELILKNTNKLDRVLGFIFYWLLMSSAFFCLLLITLNYFGVFAE